MPPVFGPASPSPTRLKSCAAPSGDRAAAVAEREERYLGTLEQLLDDDRPAERGGRAQAVFDLRVGAADEGRPSPRRARPP